MMENFIIIGIVALLVGAILFYLIRQKKKGVKCIGCPHGKQCCSKNCGSCGGGCAGHPKNSEHTSK